MGRIKTISLLICIGCNRVVKDNEIEYGYCNLCRSMPAIRAKIKDNISDEIKDDEF